MIYVLSGGEAGGLEIEVPKDKERFCVVVSKEVINEETGEEKISVKLSEKGLEYDTSASVLPEQAVYCGVVE